MFEHSKDCTHRYLHLIHSHNRRASCLKPRLSMLAGIIIFPVSLKPRPPSKKAVLDLRLFPYAYAALAYILQYYGASSNYTSNMCIHTAVLWCQLKLYQQNVAVPNLVNPFQSVSERPGNKAGKLRTWEATHLGSYASGKLRIWEATHLGSYAPGKLRTWEATHLGSTLMKIV